MKLTVIMPVYNEIKTAEEIISRVLAVPETAELIIVDDCSTDGTADFLRRLSDPRVRVFFHPENRGKGASVRTGLEHASCEAVLIQDADLEYDPEDYGKLIEAMRGGGCGAVFGSRFRGAHENFSPLYMAGNRLLTLAANLLYGGRLTDMETCYKMVKTSVLKDITLRSDRFDFEPEITAKLLKRCVRIAEVPVRYRSRAFSEGKKITWKDGFAALWALVRYRFRD